MLLDILVHIVRTLNSQYLVSSNLNDVIYQSYNIKRNFLNNIKSNWNILLILFNLFFFNFKIILLHFIYFRVFVQAAICHGLNKFSIKNCWLQMYPVQFAFQIVFLIIANENVYIKLSNQGYIFTISCNKIKLNNKQI